MTDKRMIRDDPHDVPSLTALLYIRNARALLQYARSTR